jgi:type II secretory pathway pseudopilin PulG
MVLAGESKRSGFSMRDLLVLVMVAGLLACLAIPAIRIARDEARRSFCANTLAQIGLGLQVYEDIYETYPPAFLTDEKGQPWHSWRVLLLAYFTSDPFQDCYSMQEPWDGPENLELDARSGAHSFYYCAANLVRDRCTNYVAIVGEETAWPGAVPSGLEDFAKGAAHSILVAEQVESGIRWQEPRDLLFDHLDLAVYGSFRSPPDVGGAISSAHRNGAHVVFADTSVEFLSTSTSAAVLRDMLVIGGDGPTIALAPRERLRYVYDPSAADEGPKRVPYRLESYTLDETDELGE